MEKFDPKDPAEIIPLTFEFGPLLDEQTISGAPVVEVTVYEGYDATPADVLSGSVVVVGTRVRQNATGGVLGVEYLIRVTVTTNTGLKYTLGRVLPVKSAGTY